MKLWVGLGNPGPRYAGNRHNIGFMAMDRIAQEHGFGPWRARFQGLVAEGQLGGDKIVLLKPETFMNLSGQSVRAAADFHKLTPDQITVFHDEIDLAPGRLRLKSGGGHAGHNGLRSISGHLGEGYVRVRLGIGHPGHKDAVPGYVLHDFAKADAAWLDVLLWGMCDGAAALAQGDGAGFQNAVALRTAPPRAGGGSRPPQKSRPDHPDHPNHPNHPNRPNRPNRPDNPDRPAAPATITSAAEAGTPADQTGTSPPQADSRSLLQRLADRFS